MIGEVVYKSNLASDNWIVGIAFEEEVDFIPGQYVSLKVNDEGLRRSYSVASLPGGKRIDLVVDVSPMGIGSKYVLGLKVGDKVEVLGFLGRFTIDEELLVTAKEIIFVGTGTGVVPLRPMIEDLLTNKRYLGKVRLIWGMRYEGDLFWQAELDKLQREYDNFCLDIALSRPGEKWPGVRGHVGDVIEELKLGENVAAYLCGNPEMIAESKAKLMRKGIPETFVFNERFA